MPNTSLRPFTILLIGQSISLFGSSLTGFALGVWAYQQVQSATIYATIAIAAALPIFILSPLAGAVADRWNRKRIIIIAQIAAIAITATLALLYWSDVLMPWHIIALVALNAIFSAFVLPTLAATVPLMVPKGSLIRANGMVSLAFGLIELAGPAVAGSIYTKFGMETIFIIDLVTFAAGLSVIVITYIPQPVIKEELEEHNEKGHESLLLSIRAGWHYLMNVPGLFMMTLFFSVIASSMLTVGLMVQPMVLGFSDAQTLGFIMSSAGTGVLVGSLVMIFLKNINFHVPFLLVSGFILALCAIFVPMTTTPWLLAAGGFLLTTCFPIFNANNRALFQRKVEPSMLGRVIGLRNFVLGIFRIIMIFGCGFLADKVFGPGMQEGGAFTPYFSELFGTGEGRGIAVLISLLGIFNLLITLLACSITRLRKLDTLLEDISTEEDEESALSPQAEQPNKVAATTPHP